MLPGARMARRGFDGYASHTISAERFGRLGKPGDVTKDLLSRRAVIVREFLERGRDRHVSGPGSDALIDLRSDRASRADQVPENSIPR